MNHTLAVVMPMYNEVRHVVRVLEGVPPTVDLIVVVDDGSSDGSVAAVTALASPRVLLARHVRREGVGAALQTGFRVALHNGAGIVVTMDADGQMDPGDLPALLEPLQHGTANYVKGCRFHPSVSLDSMPWTRNLGNRVLSRLCAAVLAEPDLHDVHCGYTAASRDIVAALADGNLHASYGVYNDILDRVLRIPGRVQYVPVRALYGEETSHLRPGDLPRLAILLFRLIFRSLCEGRAGIAQSKCRPSLLAKEAPVTASSRHAQVD